MHTYRMYTVMIDDIIMQDNIAGGHGLGRLHQSFLVPHQRNQAVEGMAWGDTMLKGMERAREEPRVVLGTSTGIMSSTMEVYIICMHKIVPSPKYRKMFHRQRRIHVLECLSIRC